MGELNSLLLPGAVALLPVLAFLGLLLWLDSYKLVKMHTVALLLVAGAAASGAAYGLNGWLLGVLDMQLGLYSRTVAPFAEEALKAAIVVALVATHRVAFTLDGAVCGFAVGAGFALVENVHYLQLLDDAPMGVWIIRGFGTAVMHGGATALFAVAAVAQLERNTDAVKRSLLAGAVAAVGLHAFFNLGLPSPMLAALAVMAAVPLLLLLAFDRSDKAVTSWVNDGFDADAQRLEIILQGKLSESPYGRYLQSLREHFEPEVVVDLLCYLRLSTELSMQAKSALMMREQGFAPGAPDEQTRWRFAELRRLENSIGKTGLRALAPLLPLDRKSLWQLSMLEASR